MDTNLLHQIQHQKLHLWFSLKHPGYDADKSTVFLINCCYWDILRVKKKQTWPRFYVMMWEGEQIGRNNLVFTKITILGMLTTFFLTT